MSGQPSETRRRRIPCGWAARFSGSTTRSCRLGVAPVQLLVTQLEDVDVEVARPVAHGLAGAGALRRERDHLAGETQLAGEPVPQEPVFAAMAVERVRERAGADRLPRELRLRGEQ